MIAGPAEATALGNLLVQARATRALSGDLMAVRQVAIASVDLVTYTPGVLALPAGHGRRHADMTNMRRLRTDA